MTFSPNRTFSSLLFGCFFLIQAFVSAQEPVRVERSRDKVVLGGTVYYVHVVKPGQTLYSISRAYHVSVKEMAVENPGIMSGIRVGQALKIPVEPTMGTDIDTSGSGSGEEQQGFHRVVAGETLFGISRLYQVTEKDLLEANPGVSASALQPGQLLRIPAPGDMEQEPSYNEEGYAYHRVKRKETLYSIARYYHVEVDDIREVNPEVGWGGPKAGQLLRIPLPQVVDQPDAMLDSSLVAPEGTEVDSLKEDYNYDELRDEPNDPFRTYRIAYFIPFDFQEPEPLDSLIKDVRSAGRRNRIIERYRLEQKIPQSVNFLEFFMGSLMAIDSLSRTGMKLEVHVFDTRKSMDRTLTLLLENDLEDFDLFIGPFYPYNLEIVSAFAEKNRIPVVTPFYNERDLIRSNPFLFQLSPSQESEYSELAKLVASKHDYNIVYVREEDTLDIEKHDLLKSLIFDDFDRYRPEEPVVFKEVIQKMEHTDEIIHSLSKDRKNLVVVPTSNEALASRVVSSLFYQLKDYDIEVVGTPFWTEFSSIDLHYFHDLNLIFYSSFWVDYLDPDIDKFLSGYRDHFRAEPQSTSRKGMNYGIAGHDITFYFLNALRLYGPRFIFSLDDYHPETVQHPFEFTRISRAGGYENQQIRFYRFTPGMEIDTLQVPELPERNFFFWPFDDHRRRRPGYRDRDFDR